MTLFVLYRDEQFFLDHRSNTWKFFSPLLVKLMVHALGGATALVLGVLQFSTRLRQRRPAIHRLCGRLCIGGVLLAAPMAVYLSFTHGIRTMSTETAVQSSLWALTTLMALRAARKRNFEVHRQWAMRSYAVTLIFVANRFRELPWLWFARMSHRAAQTLSANASLPLRSYSEVAAPRR
jgi:uncharacterized membrane protein